MINDENIAQNNLENNDGDPTATKASIKGFEKLIQEREHWRTEALRFTEEVTRLQIQLQNLKDEREAKDLLIDAMKRDEQVFNNRISALTSEHRDLKNHWLAEKSDLQSRLFQVQALNTQIHGTLKKKEKDYEKLQSQMSKLVKDSGRGAPKPSITISVPLKKAFSQDQNDKNPSAVTSLLRDAELCALRNTLTAVNKDNAALKLSIEELQEELVRLRVIDGPISASDPSQSIKEKEELEDSCIVNSKSLKTNEVAPASPIASDDVSCVSQVEPATPGVRSVRWLIDQTHSAVKQLRDRASVVANNQLPLTSAATQDTNQPQSQTLAVVSLKARLTEALRVIEEQDRLIHEALLGKLPGQLQPDAQPAEVVWEDPAHSEFALLADTADFDLTEDDEVKQLTASATKLRRRSLRTASLATNSSHSNNVSKNNSRRESFSLEDFEAELFPPASPETMQLLEKGGWQLPKNSFFLPPHPPSAHAATRRERLSLGGNVLSKDNSTFLVKPEVLDF